MCSCVAPCFDIVVNLRHLPLLAALIYSFCASPGMGAAATKPIMVYYMPWFTAKPYSETWGWHWTMNHFNPDNVNATGQREIASWYYPLVGP